MNTVFAKKFSKDFINSWNSHDIEKIISHYAEELEFKSPLVVKRYSDPNGTIYDREKLQEYFLIGLTNNPKLTFKFKQLLLGVNGLTLYYENARGGETAEYFESTQIIKSLSPHHAIQLYMILNVQLQPTANKFTLMFVF